MEIIRAAKACWAILSSGTRMRLTLLLAAMGLAAFLELLSLSTIPAFLGVLAQSGESANHPWVQSVQEWLSFETRRDFFEIAAVLLAAAFTLQTCYLATLAYLKARMVTRIIDEISQRLFRGYLHAPLSFHEAQHSATAASRIALESTRTANQFSFPLLHMVQSGLLMMAIIAFVIAMSPMSAVLVLIGLTVIAAVFMVAMRRRARAYGQTLTHQNAKILQDVGEALGCLKHIRLRGLEPHFETAFKFDSRARANAVGFQRFVNDFPKPVLEGTAILGLIVIVFAMLGTSNTLEGIVPTLGLIGAGVARVLPHINQLTSWILSLYQNASSARTLADELRNLDAIREKTDTERNEKLASHHLFEHSMTFNNVSYYYSGAIENSVENLSFRIEKNASVAFCGPTGAGKSTIIDLICGLKLPSAGTIEIDGRDLQSVWRPWQRRIGYIPQSIFLANRTLRENVALGLPPSAIDDGRVWTVLAQAQLDTFVAGLPAGLDAEVGENGIRLSGGQRQRIGIARALYHDPDILILDEATAALDNETERRLMQAIEAVRSNRTLIMIAHRLSSIRNCDKIIFLDDGQVTGTGTYDELLRSHDSFRAMAG